MVIDVSGTDELNSALNNLSLTDPVIRLRGGHYLGPFVGKVPNMKFRGYPNERSYMEVAKPGEIVLTTTKDGCSVEQLCIQNISPDRGDLAVELPNAYRNSLVKAMGDNFMAINCDFFDGGSVIAWFEGASGGELVGNLMLDFGYMDKDRGHGHGVYANNYSTSPTKFIRQNVVANYMSTAIKTSTDAGYEFHYVIERNTILTEDDSPDSAGMQFYAKQHRADDMSWLHNRVFTPNLPALTSWYGYGERHGSARIIGNFLVGSRACMWDVAPFDHLTIRDNIMAFTGWLNKPGVGEPASPPLVRDYGNNRYFGPSPLNPTWTRHFKSGGTNITSAQWFAITGDTSTYVNDLFQVPNRVWVDRNEYEAKRATITVHNLMGPDGICFSGTPRACVDDVLDDGDEWYLYGATNPEAGPIASGIHQAGVPIDLPTDPGVVGNRTPAGLTPRPSSFPQFGAYILRNRSTWTAA